MTQPAVLIGCKGAVPPVGHGVFCCFGCGHYNTKQPFVQISGGDKSVPPHAACSAEEKPALPACASGACARPLLPIYIIGTKIRRPPTRTAEIIQEISDYCALTRARVSLVSGIAACGGAVAVTHQFRLHISGLVSRF